jgi:quercetin dioxygenase-like cupin family protein
MANDENPFHVDLRSLPAVTLPTAVIRPFTTDDVQVVFVEAGAGTQLPAHSHPEEQLTFVISGRIRVEIEGQAPFEIGPHELAHFPANIPHHVEVMEDTVSYDVFSPANQELARRARDAQADLGYR